ncbi:MAG TPA: rhamnulokinase family protein [Gaiellaceae bacterium]|jgi:rhamnulokinase|nr:rhamnulokinase family protein [Gaiellaceae bacterium]
MATLVAVDLGAQSGRVALGRFDGERLAVSTVHRFENVPVRTRGRLQWDILGLYQSVLEGLRIAGREPGVVDSVGVDSWAVDFALLDATGRLVQNPVHYRDARRASAVDRVLARVPARELYERTGIQLMPINTIFELAAMVDEGDPSLEVAETLLMVPDLLHYWLGGDRVCELTNATTTQCFATREGGWAVDLLERLDIPARFLPPVVPPGTVLGPLSSDVAEETSLRQASVVAGATHDTASAVAAIPFRRAGSVYISAGTWSLVGLEVSRPMIDDRTFAANLTNEGGVEGTSRLLRNVTGLWLLHECRRVWALEGHDYSFEELASLALEAPSLQSLVDPNHALFAPPGDMPQRIRAFCAMTGQAEPEEPAAVARCILESLALKHAQTIDLIRRSTGAKPGEVHIVGGGARNELLCRWTANAAALPVVAGPVEATEIGNLVVQAIAIGELASVEEGRAVVRASFEPTVYEPADSEAWREARDRFEKVAAESQVREEIGA